MLLHWQNYEVSQSLYKHSVSYERVHKSTSDISPTTFGEGQLFGLSILLSMWLPMRKRTCPTYYTVQPRAYSGPFLRIAGPLQLDVKEVLSFRQLQSIGGGGGRLV